MSGINSEPAAIYPTSAVGSIVSQKKTFCGIRYAGLDDVLRILESGDQVGQTYVLFENGVIKMKSSVSLAEYVRRLDLSKKEDRR